MRIRKSSRIYCRALRVRVPSEASIQSAKSQMALGDYLPRRASVPGLPPVHIQVSVGFP